MEWFGGKADGEYKFQKLLFKDVGAGFGVKSLFQDPEMRAAYAAYGDVDLIGKQQSLARKKDVVTPWFGEWNDVNGAAVAAGGSRQGHARAGLEDVGRQVDRAEEAGVSAGRGHGAAGAAPRPLRGIR